MRHDEVHTWMSGSVGDAARRQTWGEGGDHISRWVGKGQGALQEEGMVERGECRTPW